MNLPSKNDFIVYNSLDELQAYEHFFNKTIKEGTYLFIENSLYYQEDLMWMGMPAFNFYLQSVNDYLKSIEANDDSDIIACLYSIITFRVSENDFHLAVNRLQEIILYIIKNYNKFNVNEDIYGNLLEKYALLQNELKKYAKGKS